MPEIQKLKETLSEALSEGILSHAILIEGPKGTGKRDLILWLAEAILCPKEVPPCGNCAVCRKVRDGNHPDVETILPEKDSIGIGSIRSLKESLFLAPSEAQQKVYLIPNAEKMTVEAQNALLKSLEEPPSYARFLLTAENKNDLLDTIRSRVTIYTLEAPSRKACAAELQKLLPELSAEDADLLSLAVSGNYGAGKEILENERFPLVKLAFDTPKLLRKAKGYDLASGLSKAIGDRSDFLIYCEALQNLVGRCGIDRAAGKNTPITVSATETVKTLEALDRAREAIEGNCSLELTESWLCLALSGIFGG